MIHLDPTKRHDFIILFDVENANPNGDPDAGNLPRVDPETMHGFTTDVSIKRKVRDYLQRTHNLDMFIQSEIALNRLIFKAAEDVGVETPKETLTDTDEALIEYLTKNEIENIEFDPEKRVVRYTGESFKKDEIQKALAVDEDNADIKQRLRDLANRLAKSVKNKKKLDKEDRDNTRNKMIEDFYDIRMFGAVLSTGLNAGQVRGPVQLTFAKSRDPIFRLDCGITRVAVTREQDKQRKETEMARKPVVPYALYRGYGFYNPYLALKPKKNGEKSNALMKDNGSITCF